MDRWVHGGLPGRHSAGDGDRYLPGMDHCLEVCSMSDIYLIRHTTPAVDKGICYGQTDLDVTESFMDEAAVIRQHLPPVFSSVHSSPLQRCSRLAAHLFPELPLTLHPQLMEIHCGEWE